MGDFLCVSDSTKSRRWQRHCIPLYEFDLNFQNPPTRKLGIDVEAKYEDIKRIYFKRYLKQIIAIGEDPQDMLQEILQGILIRNKGKCPYDPKKSAFSTYVTMVCHCVMTNFLKKHSKTKGVEIAIEPIEGRIHDLEDVEIERDYQELRRDIGSLFKGDYRKVFDLLTDGYKTKEISEIMGVESKVVRKHVNDIREIVTHKTQLGSR